MPLARLITLLSDPVDTSADEVVRALALQLPEVGLVLFDRDLRVRLAEGPPILAAGHHTDSVRGRELRDVATAGAAEVLVPQYRAVLTGERRSFEFASALTGRQYTVHAGPIRDPDGAIVGGIAIVVDATDVLEQLRTTADAEAHYRLLAETASDVVSLHDLDGRYVWISPSVQTVFGYRPEDIVGRNAFEFAHPEDAPAVAETLTALGDGAETRVVEFRTRHASGAYGWVESAITAIRDERGEVELRVASRDITQRKDHERRVVEARDELRRRLAQTRGLARLGECALQEDDVPRLLETAAAIIAETLDVPLVAVVEMHSPGRVLVRAGVGWEPDVIGSVVEATLGSGDETIDRIAEEPVMVHAVGDDPDFDVEVLRRHGAVDGAQVLIGERGAPWGVLGVWSDGPRTFDEDDRDFLRAAAHIAGEAIAREAARLAALHESMHDSVTGLPNRALLADRLEHGLTRRGDEECRIGVFLLNLDGFKVVNDSMGHGVGDQLLAQVGPRLVTVVRPGDTVARFGGDSFGVMCEDIDDEAHAHRLAERIIAAFARPFVVGDHSFFVSASVGVVVATGGESAADILRDADAAVYRAKDAGGNRYELFDPDMRERVVQRIRVEAELRRALTADELRVHFQPIFRLPERRLAAVEALVRWEHPDRGMVAPGEFIPVAEDSGLIVPLGTWVLRAACRQVAHWPEIDLTVNLSARQVAQPDLVRIVGQALADSGLEPERLGLEITERLLMQDSDAVATTLRGLKDLGVRLILDDFGTGYSSLSYLKRFPLDRLKIDRSFVAGVCHREDDRAIVAAIIGMAGALRLSVIPEGVETEAQLTVLGDLGCRLAQGFLLGRPMPSDELEAAFPLLASGVGGGT